MSQHWCFAKIQQELQKIGLLLDRRSILKAIRQQEIISEQREQLPSVQSLNEALKQIYICEAQIGRTKETVDLHNQIFRFKQSLIGSDYSQEGKDEILRRLKNLQKKRNYRMKQWRVA